MAFALAINNLSGSTNGAPVLVVATATTGTTIHTAQAGTAGNDVLYIEITNTDSSTRTVTLERGSTTASSNQVWTLAAGTTVQVPPFALNNAKVLTAFASVANVCNIAGFVRTYTN